MLGADLDGLLRSAVASLCLAAGVLHISAAADHRGMGSHVAFFVVVAIIQSALAPAVLWGRSGRWLALAAGCNVAVAAVWVASRTTGLPVDASSAAESIGFKDGITTMLELGAVVGAGFWWLLPEASRRIALQSRRLAAAMLGTGVWALGASGLFAGHTHSAGHTHEGGHAQNAAHGHGPGPAAGASDSDHGTHAHPLTTAVAAGPTGGDHHHNAGQRSATGATAAAPPGHAHSHAPGDEHRHTTPVPRQAASHLHSDAPPATTPHDHQGHDQPVQGDTQNGHGHDHDHGHGRGPTEPDQDQDRGGSEKDRAGDGGGGSALEDLLRLIQPR